jgi:hypothetical protein
MTRSGFKTAQKNRNLEKKENNNKDYRIKKQSLLVFKWCYRLRLYVTNKIWYKPYRN